MGDGASRTVFSFLIDIFSNTSFDSWAIMDQVQWTKTKHAVNLLHIMARIILTRLVLKKFVIVFYHRFENTVGSSS